MVDEDLDETLRDMANYCIMYISHRRRYNKKIK